MVGEGAIHGRERACVNIGSVQIQFAAAAVLDIVGGL